MPPQNATSNGIVRIEDKRQRPPKLHDLPSLQKLGRVISTCYFHGEDIEAWTTRSGWALAYRKSSLDYVDDEAAQGGAYRCREAPLVRRPRAAKCRADLRTP